MTIAEEKNAFLPRLRDDIIIGPPQHMGGVIVYYLKDRFTNWFYRIGVKEYFLISQMDGSKSLQELNVAYQSQFGRSLNAHSWEGLFALLEKRQLLANTADISKLEEIKREVIKRKREENNGLLRRRIPLVQPDSFLGHLLPLCKFMFHRAFVLPALVGILALEIFVGLHFPSLLSDALSARSNIWNYILFFLLAGIFTVLHEVAHGLACKNFGGSVSEMGLLWRYLAIFPYCKIDDVMLFHNRWHRVYASFAGIFVNLLSIIPFSLIWLFIPASSIWHTISALMLLSFNLATLVNFIPFIELDGYFMLNHALGMVDLRKESHRFCKQGVFTIFFKQGSSHSNLPQRDKTIYLIYGFFSLTVTGVFLVGMALYWFLSIRYWLGNSIAWGGVLLLALVLFYRELGKRKKGLMPRLLQRFLRIEA